MIRLKLLFIGNVGYRFNSFAYSSSLAAKHLGIEFHIAGAWTGYDNPEDRLADEKKYGIKIHQIDFIRTTYDLRNIKAYRQIVELIENERIDIIHCNTPIGGVVGRLAGKKCKVKPVIYQAHGFHFYSGAPLINWIVYYPIEKFLAHKTDALITINNEDFLRAQKFHLRNHGKVYFVPGVGIDPTLFSPKQSIRNSKRNELGLSDEDIMVISVGDLVDRKNYKVSIESIARTKNRNLRYYICGEGPQRKVLEKKVNSLGISKQVYFLGYRSDIRELLQAADIYLFSSRQEGLPRSLMEAMACGLPCVVSNIRGNTDLMMEEKNGYLVEVNDITAYAEKLNTLAQNKELRLSMGSENIRRIHDFDLGIVENALLNVYSSECVLR